MTLPSFLIIGAQRSGTTTLHYALARHPQIFMSPAKEVQFFLRSPHGDLPSWAQNQDRIPQTLDEYAQIFAGAGPQHRAIGEASPGYLWGPAAVWIHHAMPHAKIVAILRQPLDQARSILKTWMGIKRDPTIEELDEALRDDLPGPRGTAPLVQHGRYYDHLRPYFDRFPRRQIKILTLDELEHDPNRTMNNLLRFLGVDPIQLEVPHFNPSGKPRIPLVAPVLRLARALLPEIALRHLRPMGHRLQRANTKLAEPIPREIRAMMTELYYGQSIRDLEHLTDLDLIAWRCGSDAALERATNFLRRAVA